MLLRHAQGNLSRRPAGPFGYAQGRLLRLAQGRLLRLAQGRLPALLSFSVVNAFSFRRCAAGAVRVPRRGRLRLLPA
jgi:hypothetical protein